MGVNDQMTALADAIRGKTGGTEALSIGEMTEAIGELTTEELIQHSDIPEYVKAEALEVANKVQDVRQPDSIVFLAMSDSHHYGQQAGKDSYTDADGVQTTTSNTHAAMAAKVLAYALKMDFMAHLGDISWGHKLTTPELLKTQIEDLSDLLDEANTGIPCFRAIGNHDSGIYYHDQAVADGKTGVFTLSGEYLYENFTAYSESEDTVVGGQEYGGYCYRDFKDKKLRVFLLNTSEGLVKSQADNAMLGSQRAWFADALLDLNSKSDAAKWSFIVLSHYPADYGGVTLQLAELLKKYVDGGSFSVWNEKTDATSTANFSGKNAAKMVAQFHGHVHNFLASKLHSYATGSGVKFDAWRICVPNGQFNRENYYSTTAGYPDHSFADATTYAKTANSANETSFVVNVVNPSEKVVYSFCYGAGKDRVIGYAATTYYSVTSNLTNAMLKNNIASVEEGDGYTNTLTAKDGYELTSVTVTMGGVDITASAYLDEIVSIENVTGDIVITAYAAEVTAYTNLLPTATDDSGNVYNGVGYKSGYRIGSSGTESSQSGSYTTGFVPCSANDVIRLKNIEFGQVTTSVTASNQRLSFYDAGKNHIGQVNSSTAVNALLDAVRNDSGGIVQFTAKETYRWNSADVSLANVAYFRLNGTYIGPDSVITANEEIK